MSTSLQPHTEPSKAPGLQERVQESAPLNVGHEEARLALQSEALKHLSSPKQFNPMPGKTKSAGALASFIDEAEKAESGLLGSDSAFAQNALAKNDDIKPKINPLANHTAIQTDGGKSYLALDTQNLYSPQAKAKADQLIAQA